MVAPKNRVTVFAHTCKSHLISSDLIQFHDAWLSREASFPAPVASRCLAQL